MAEGYPDTATGRRCNALVTAVRVFAVRLPGREENAESVREENSESGETKTRLPRRRYPHEALVFDTETYTGPAQQLMILAWRLYRDRGDGEPGITCIEEGFAYPDDLADTDPDGFSTLADYVRRPPPRVAPGFPLRVELRPLSWWLEKRLYRYGWDHRDRCHVVGFNLPFDLGRIASYWAPARGYYRGGWSLGLWGRFDEQGRWEDSSWARRVLLKAIDPRRTLFGWGSRTEGEQDQPDWKGDVSPFVDLRTLTFALTDRGLKLEGACAAFGHRYEKPKVRYGAISERLLTYAQDDVEHTGRLYRNCMAELARHEGIDLAPQALYSPATVGTKYLEAMGVERPMEKFTNLDPTIHGRAMSAFFGGRAEARIVRTPVPVVYVDAASMYPTVNALLRTWRLLIAERIDVADATEDVRSLLADPHLLDRCYEREFWRESIGVTLVELSDPADQVLPVRAYYEPESADPGIGVNPLTYRGRLWYMLPDVVASVLLTEGRVPHVSRALRLVPVAIQTGLRPVKLRGGPFIHPATSDEDPFVAMVQERHRVLNDPDLPENDRKRLEQFLKITANATAYGVLARFDRKDRSDPAKVTVYGPDEETTDARTKNPEDPGPFCFPPVAASITAGARLVLALLERAVTDAGGVYAFCDTDSMGVVVSSRRRTVSCSTAKGETIEALSGAEVRSILDRFGSLNPYDPDLVGSFWKVEHDSLRRPLRCYAISAKRYSLDREEEGGRRLVRVVDSPEEWEASDEIGAESGEDSGLVDWSEHGLGLYVDPTDPENPRRDAEGRRLWIREAWEWVLAGDPTAPLPAWAHTYAITQFTVSGPRIAGWFAGFDASVQREERIRPGTFGLLAHPTGFVSELSGGALPAAPYESDPKRWASLPWYDRRTGRPVRVTTLEPLDEAFAGALARGDVRINTLGDVLTTYPLRPEHKSLAPDGNPVGRETYGLLLRRPLESAPVLTDLIGKEGNRLIERVSGEVTEASEYRIDYGAREDRWRALVLPVLRTMGAVEVSRRSGRSRRAVERAIRLTEATEPHASTKALYLRAGANWAAERLRRWAVDPGPDPLGTLYCYLTEAASQMEIRTCTCGCGLALPGRHTRWYSDAHRRRADRPRRRGLQ